MRSSSLHALLITLLALVPATLHAKNNLKNFPDFLKESDRRECTGCHTEEREIPAGTQHANGFQGWKDHQCWGCHNEISSIAISFVSGKKDKRYYGLPVADSVLERIGKNPMIYLDAPKQLHFEKYDPARLKDFLSHPYAITGIGRQRNIKMPAYPQYGSGDHQKFLGKGNSIEGKKIVEAKCISCHTEENSPVGRNLLGLALFSPKYLYNYANKTSTLTSPNRKMPKISVSRSEANDIFSFLGSTVLNKRKRLAAELKSIKPEVLQNSQDSSLKPLQLEFIWNSFFRVGGCVHCHGIEGRARSHFDVSDEGTLKSWLGKNNPMEIWKRLEIRSHELKVGIGAKTPGMPMTGPALPKPIRNLVFRWIEEGCLDTDQQPTCKSLNNN